MGRASWSSRAAATCARRCRVWTGGSCWDDVSGCTRTAAAAGAAAVAAADAAAVAAGGTAAPAAVAAAAPVAAREAARAALPAPALTTGSPAPSRAPSPALNPGTSLAPSPRRRVAPSPEANLGPSLGQSHETRGPSLPETARLSPRTEAAGPSLESPPKGETARPDPSRRRGLRRTRTALHLARGPNLLRKARVTTRKNRPVKVRLWIRLRLLKRRKIARSVHFLEMQAGARRDLFRKNAKIAQCLAVREIDPGRVIASIVQDPEEGKIGQNRVESVIRDLAGGIARGLAVGSIVRDHVGDAIAPVREAVGNPTGIVLGPGEGKIAHDPAIVVAAEKVPGLGIVQRDPGGGRIVLDPGIVRTVLDPGIVRIVQDLVRSLVPRAVQIGRGRLQRQETIGLSPKIARSPRIAPLRQILQRNLL